MSVWLEFLCWLYFFYSNYGNCFICFIASVWSHRNTKMFALKAILLVVLPLFTNSLIFQNFQNEDFNCETNYSNQIKFQLEEDHTKTIFLCNDTSLIHFNLKKCELRCKVKGKKMSNSAFKHLCATEVLPAGKSITVLVFCTKVTEKKLFLAILTCMDHDEKVLHQWKITTGKKISN